MTLQEREHRQSANVIDLKAADWLSVRTFGLGMLRIKPRLMPGSLNRGRIA